MGARQQSVGHNYKKHNTLPQHVIQMYGDPQKYQPKQTSAQKGYIDQQKASLSPRMKPELTKRRSQMAQIAA